NCTAESLPATRQKTNAHNNQVPTPHFLVVLDVESRDFSAPKFLLDVSQRRVLHPAPEDRNPVEQVFRLCLAHVGLHPFHVQQHHSASTVIYANRFSGLGNHSTADGVSSNEVPRLCIPCAQSVPRLCV